MKTKLLIMLPFLGALAPAAAVADAAPQAVLQAVERLAPGAAQAVSPSPVAGLYEVVIGPRLFYMSGDGRFLVDGDVIDLAAQSNLSEPRRDTARVGALDNLGEDSMVVYTPKQFAHTITVFTDIDCPYCQRMHAELEAYLARGIRVRYLAYPRSGPDTPSYDKAVAVWCSADPGEALTRAKQGRTVEAKSCEHPVRRHLTMGQMLGIRGTPTIVLDNGKVLPGYVPAEQLAELLEPAAQNSAADRRAR